VKLLRDGKERALSATLAELPTEELASVEPRQQPGSGRAMQGLSGIEVTELDARFRRQFDIPSDMRGAIVTSVDPESRACEAGLKPGDLIIEVNRQKVGGTRELTEAIRKARGGRLLLRVWSQGGGRFIVMEPDTTREQGEPTK
jgi:serine protease Do